MSDLAPLKFIAVAGVVLTAFLMGIGIFANKEGEKNRVQYRSAREQQMEMFNQALEQAREAQQLNRMHMEMQRNAMMEAEYGPDYQQYMANY